MTVRVAAGRVSPDRVFRAAVVSACVASLACLASVGLFATIARGQGLTDSQPPLSVEDAARPAGSAAGTTEADRHHGEPVTEDEARELLRELEHLYDVEDAEAVIARHGEGLQPLARMRVTRVFDERNYIDLAQRVVAIEPLADGRLRVDVVAVMRSRLVDEPFDRREKTRWSYVLARSEEGVVRIVEGRDATMRRLGARPTWRPEDWTIELDLAPRPTNLGTPEGTALVSGRVLLRNVSGADADVLGFAVNPFAGPLKVSIDGVARSFDRDEGPGDTVWIDLPQAVPADGALTVEFDYGIDLVGRNASAQLGEAGGHFFSESAWHPLFGAARHDRPQSAPHDLTVVAPPGLSPVAPGLLAEVSERPDGRRAWRWFSRFPGDEMAVVVTQASRREVDVGEGVTLDLWTAETGREATASRDALVGRVRSALAYFARVVGPPPVDRFTIVAAPSMEPDTLRAAPAFVALGTLDIGEPDARNSRTSEPVFFLGHHLAHLWFVDSVDVRGPGALALTEGLSDHLASAWYEDEVAQRLVRRWRGHVLNMLLPRADLDRPVASDTDFAPASSLFGRGKAWLALDQFRAFAGEERWRAALSSYWKQARGRVVEFPVLARALGGEDERLQAFVAAWFLGRGLAQPKVAEVRHVPAADGSGPGWAEIVLRNEGVGPILVNVRSRIDGEPFDDAVELDTGGTAILRYPAALAPASVALDPDHWVWQVEPTDDVYPPERPVRREELKSPRAIDPSKVEEIQHRVRNR